MCPGLGPRLPPALHSNLPPLIFPSSSLPPPAQYCTVKRLSHEFGWKSKEIVATLEAKRKVKSAEYYEAKKKSIVRWPVGLSGRWAVLPKGKRGRGGTGKDVLVSPLWSRLVLPVSVRVDAVLRAAMADGLCPSPPARLTP